MMQRLAGTLGLVLALFGSRVSAQCPDGTPLPCALPIAKTSVAVLDFRVLSTDTTDGFLGDGLADEMAVRLGQVDRLVVISRASVKRLSGAMSASTTTVGRALRTTFLVNGSVRRAGTRLRITVELLRADNGVQVWSQQFDRSPSDLLDVQTEVATEVTTAIAGRLLPAERAALAARPTTNPEAWASYLRALGLWRGGTLDPAVRHRAITLLDRALALDSAFASAHALLSMFHGVSYLMYEDRSPGRLDRQRWNAERARALAPAAVEPRVALGLYHYWGRRDYGRAMEEFTAGMRFNRNNADLHDALAGLLRRTGRWEESIDERRRQCELDPLSAGCQAGLGDTYLFLRRLDEGEATLRRAVNQGGVGIFGPLAMARIQLLKGDSSALTEAIRAVVSFPDPSGLFAPTPGGYRLFSPLLRVDRSLQSLVAASAMPAGRDAQLVWHLARAEALAALGEPAAAVYDSARAIASAFVQERAGDDAAHSALAIALAQLGLKAEARREAERGVTLLPLQRDAYVGAIRLLDLIEVEILIGDLDKAVEHLAIALSVPSPVTIGLLRLDPLYKPLRGRADFDRLLAQREKTSPR